MARPTAFPAVRAATNPWRTGLAAFALAGAACAGGAPSSVGPAISRPTASVTDSVTAAPPDHAIDPCPVGSTVDLARIFPDPALREAVLLATGALRPTQAGEAGPPPTCRDLAGLQRLRIEKKCSSLTGIATLAGLQEILVGERFDYYARRGPEASLTLTDLKALAALPGLVRLSVGPLASLADLAGLTRLEELRIDAVASGDLRPLQALSRLRVLQIGAGDPDVWKGNPNHDRVALRYALSNGGTIADLSSVASLSQLRVLEIPGATIGDVSPLSALKGLEVLNLRKNRVRDLGPLRGLGSLRVLYLEENQVENLEPLSGLSHLRDLRLNDNPVEDIAALGALGELEELYLDRTRVRDARPIGDLPKLKTLWACRTPATFGPEWKLNKPTFLRLRQRGVSAPDFVGCTCC